MKVGALIKNWNDDVGIVVRVQKQPDGDTFFWVDWQDGSWNGECVCYSEQDWEFYIFRVI